MKRKIYNRVLEWKEKDNGSCGLLLDGTSIVSQELRSRGHKPYFYSRSDTDNRENNMEIDW